MKSIKETVIYAQSWSPLLPLKRETDYCKLLQEYPLLRRLSAQANRATCKLHEKLDNVKNEEY